MLSAVIDATGRACKIELLCIFSKLRLNTSEMLIPTVNLHAYFIDRHLL